MKIVNIISKLPRKGQIGKRKEDKINYCIIHHDVISIAKPYNHLARYKAIADYHINGKKYDGIAYHFKIASDGTIYQTRDTKDITWHASNRQINLESVAVCLDGNFETEKPTQRQLEGLERLLNHLIDTLGIKKGNIKGHREVAEQGTLCPGKNLLPFIVNFRKQKEVFHTVKKGETINAIAKKHKITAQKIAKLNPRIKNLNKIEVGQKIRIK